VRGTNNTSVCEISRLCLVCARGAGVTRPFVRHAEAGEVLARRTGYEYLASCVVLSNSVFVFAILTIGARARQGRKRGLEGASRPCALLPQRAGSVRDACQRPLERIVTLSIGVGDTIPAIVIEFTTEILVFSSRA